MKNEHQPNAPRAGAGRSLAHTVLGGIGALAAAYGAAALGGLTMRGRGRPTGRWFRSLHKPAFQPPNWVFGPDKVDTRAALTVAPYLGWLGFATTLNTSIVAKNR